MTSCCVCASISATACGLGGAAARTGSTTSAGTTPAAACASRTSVSILHHSSYLCRLGPHPAHLGQGVALDHERGPASWPLPEPSPRASSPAPARAAQLEGHPAEAFDRGLLEVVLELGKAHPQSRVMHGHDLHGQDGGVLGVVQTHARHRHPGWHLGDRQQGVQAVHRATPDRDADHRKDRVRGHDAGQRRAHARAGDHHLDAPRLELGHPVGQCARRTVRRNARLVVADPEPGQHGTGLAHDVLVTGGPVDDGHSRAGAGRHGHSSGAGTPGVG